MNFNITTACQDMALSAAPSFALSYLIYRNTNQAMLTAGIAAGANLVGQVTMPLFQAIMNKWPISSSFLHSIVSHVAYNVTRSFTKTQDLFLSAYQTRFISVIYLIHAAKFVSCHLYVSYTQKSYSAQDAWKLSGRMTWLV